MIGQSPTWLIRPTATKAVESGAHVFLFTTSKAFRWVRNRRPASARLIATQQLFYGFFGVLVIFVIFRAFVGFLHDIAPGAQRFGDAG